MNEINERPIFEHVSELRNRVIRVFVVVILISSFVFIFSIQNIEIRGISVPIPYPDVYNNSAARLISMLQDMVLPSYVDIILTTPGQALSAQIYVSLLVGIVVSMPLILWQISAFVNPGLHRKEIKLLRNLLIPASLLFFIGSFFSLRIMIPTTLEFLYRYGLSLRAETLITINEFISFIIFFILAFGIAFQLPIIMWLLTKLEIVKSEVWKENWRYTFIILVILGAIITPDASGVTMWLITIPMMALYIIGYLTTRSIKQET